MAFKLSVAALITSAKYLVVSWGEFPPDNSASAWVAAKVFSPSESSPLALNIPGISPYPPADSNKEAFLKRSFLKSLALRLVNLSLTDPRALEFSIRPGYKSLIDLSTLTIPEVWDLSEPRVAPSLLSRRPLIGALIESILDLASVLVFMPPP